MPYEVSPGLDRARVCVSDFGFSSLSEARGPACRRRTSETLTSLRLTRQKTFSDAYADIQRDRAPQLSIRYPKSPMRRTPLSRLISALPQADGMAARLRRCAAGVRRRDWAGAGVRPDCSIEISSQSCVPADALLAVVSTAAGDVSLAILPQRWPALASAATLTDQRQRRAVAGLLLARYIGCLAEKVLTVELHGSVPAGRRTTGVVVHCGGARLDVLEVDAAFLSALEADPAALPLDWPHSAGGLRLPSRIVLGRRRIAPATLRGLRPFDVVLLPPQPFTQHADIALAIQPVSALLCWGDDDACGLQTRVLIQSSTMTLTDVPAAAAGDAHAGKQPSAAARALARLELPVQFELAGPSLGLADIASLSADDVLELALPLDQARVRITVAGQAVGMGELVSVGGRLGVRIVRMDLADLMDPADRSGRGAAAP